MSRRGKRWSILTAALVGVAALGYGYWRYSFPYGYTHCCDLILHQALEEYAAEHDGAFPGGQATPEASLSLLYPKYANAYLLGGKAVPESEAEAILERGEPLSPESCSWHYLEGLHLYDDPRLALFWDKTGLGHSGQRLSCGGHTVLFVGGERRHISAEEWPRFVQEQQDLVAQRGGGCEIRVDGTGQLGGQRVHAQLRAISGSLYARVWREGRRSSSQLIAHIDREPDQGVVGLPVVTAAEVRDAKVMIDERRITFVLKSGHIVFDGSGFSFK
jgi:hypothetical protein